MAAVLTEPDTAKAATLDSSGAMTFFSFPIEKVEDAGDGTVEVIGKATDGTLDSDLQIVDPDWSAKAIQEWYDTGANVRVQHNAQRDPAGKGLQVDGHTVRVKVVEPVAAKLVKAGVLQDFSVGIMNPDIRRSGDPRFKHLDPMGKAVNGIITGRDDGMSKIGEISLVDRGSNFGTRFAMMKAAGATGAPEWVGELTAPDEVLAKVGEATVTKVAKPKTVTVELPRNMSVSIKPTDLAKLANLKRGLETQRTKMAQPDAVKSVEEARTLVGEEGQATYAAKAATDAPEDAALVAVKTAEAGVYKRDIDTATRRRLAGEGRALSNLSYPIETHEDAHNAATLALSGHGDVGAAKKLIRRIASKEGWTDVLDRLKGKKKDKVVKTAEPVAPVATTVTVTGAPDAQVLYETVKQQVTGYNVKSAKPASTKKKGKLRAVCPSCGAKQNPKHVHCPECGGKLPDKALIVAKNHDFVCLHCGKELDKGEKHCPECGHENPGYLPEADRKIPANQDADKAAKGGKKGKKGKPFGGSQAPPFGKDKDGDGDDDADSKKAARVIKGSQSKGKKGKGGHKPTPGSASGAVGAAESPVPAHREPDGGAVEAFEADAHMEDGDGPEAQSKVPVMAGKAADPEMAASMHLKALGVPAGLGALHALTCPAYAPEDVAKAFPSSSFADQVDPAEWQMADLEKAATGPIGDGLQALALGQAALSLKTADPYLLDDLRTEAHKAFRDANPGPSSFPTPGELSPQRFHRPYITDGRAAPSPGQDAPHSVKLPPAGGISASSYQRGYIEAGHASDGPDNQHTPGPVAPPAQTGMPTHDPAQGYVTSAARDTAMHAIGALHDHIGRIFPDVCPMNPGDNDFRHPVPSPTGGVTPAPGAKKAAKAAARKAKRAAARKAAKAKAKKAAQRRKMETLVLKGKVTVDDARAKLGLKPMDITKTAEPAVTEDAPPAAAGPDPKVIAKAVAKATRPLQKTLARQGKELKQVRKTADAIAGSPDTSGAPYRGAALTKTSAPPVVAPTPAGVAEHAQLEKMRILQQEALGSPDPARRVAAWAELDHLLGIAPDNTPQYTPLRR